MATTRVYILAKELGVKSSAIIKKCQDEDLDIKNHMSVISAGLAATIQEWFSEGENVTTVETSEKVDLSKVRIKRKKKKVSLVKKEHEDLDAQDVAADTDNDQDTDEADDFEHEEDDLTLTDEETGQVEDQEPQEEQEPESVPDTEPVQEVKPEPEPEPASETKPKPEPEPEPEPEVIVPAGPILQKPEPARLSGPQVVRVEAPEPLRRRPKPRPRAKYNDPVTEPLMYSQGKGESFTQTTDKKGSPKKRKDRTHGRRRGEVEPDSSKKAKSPGSKWRERDIAERRARLDAAGGESLRLRPSRKITSKQKSAQSTPSRPAKVSISAPITVKDLSSALGIKATDIITKLMQQNIMANANQVISNEVAELIALEFDVELDIAHKVTIEKQIEKEFEEREGKNIKKRSVIAAMLGHVDHGKTSLLDKIRSSHVASGEAGGITQHIGASEIIWDDKKVTFIDTPGHEAFTAMRARGANMTDVVVLVVAADDGVMPQTIEAIAHSKAAGVPIIVALNKIDLPGCDINRIYAELSEHGLTPSEWGGDTEVVKTSATTGEGVNDLLESLDYIAELLELKADDTIPAIGWVLEAKMSPKQGPLATILIKEGKLSKGDVILAGTAYGRIKMMKNTYGKAIKTATSSMPVEITGLNDIPQAGDRFYCLGSDLNKAKAAAEENQTISREHSLSERNQVTLDNLFSHIEAGKTQTLNLIIRADVQGSIDVLKKYLTDLSTDEIKLNILHASTGGITEGDVVLAEASNAIIIGFNVVSEEHAQKTAEAKGVEIRLYNIIYRITEDLQKSMLGMLEPEEQEKNLGRAVVRQIFKISRIGTIAGCYVTSGVVTKNAKIRLIRNNIIIKDDLVLETLKHFKNDAKEVKSGLECGIKVSGFDDIKVDDIFDCYEIIKVARTL